MPKMCDFNSSCVLMSSHASAHKSARGFAASEIAAEPPADDLRAKMTHLGAVANADHPLPLGQRLAVLSLMVVSILGFPDRFAPICLGVPSRGFRLREYRPSGWPNRRKAAFRGSYTFMNAIAASLGLLMTPIMLAVAPPCREWPMAHRSARAAFPKKAFTAQ